MSKAKPKAKSGIGKGTGKKGWNRWEKGKNKAKSYKPYTSKDNKEATGQKGKQPQQAESEWVDG